ncbi:MAG: 5'-methylthioadenosine phosphorylase [Alphaproteobacteria bacterium]|nr:MAG: 5'-methylthioadenosine phosphorylase [Alphaproteobacteria bacterium]
MRGFRNCAVLFALAALPGEVAADGYIMGAGRWTCAQVRQVAESGTPAEVGQLAGWLLGFWSAATLQRETHFVDIVEQVGGEKIVRATVQECAKAPSTVRLHEVAGKMIENTR